MSSANCGLQSGRCSNCSALERKYPSRWRRWLFSLFITRLPAAYLSIYNIPCCRRARSVSSEIRIDHGIARSPNSVVDRWRQRLLGRCRQNLERSAYVCCHGNNVSLSRNPTNLPFSLIVVVVNLFCVQRVRNLFSILSLKYDAGRQCVVGVTVLTMGRGVVNRVR